MSEEETYKKRLENMTEVEKLKAEVNRLGHLCNQYAAREAKLKSALQWFIDRVDSGEVRSKKTYSKFKALLEEANKL